jgi:hypothetical protein
MAAIGIFAGMFPKLPVALTVGYCSEVILPSPSH